MIDLHTYLKQQLCNDDYIQEVYELMGEGEISTLARDIRDVKYPCVICELGDDGSLNMSGRFDDSSVHLFYVVDKWSTQAPGDRQKILAKAKSKGLEILHQMQTDAKDYGDPMYGVDFSKITYYKTAPGQYTIGYCFVLTAINE